MIPKVEDTVVLTEKCLTVIQDEELKRFVSSAILEIRFAETLVTGGTTREEKLMKVRKDIRDEIDKLQPITNRVTYALRLLELCVMIHINHGWGHKKRVAEFLKRFETAFRKFDYKYL